MLSIYLINVLKVGDERPFGANVICFTMYWLWMKFSYFYLYSYNKTWQIANRVHNSWDIRGTRRNNNVIMTSKRRRDVVSTS